MKKITQLLSALVFCSLMIFISCGGDEPGAEDDPRDVQAEKLEGSWTVTSATFDQETRPDWEEATVSISYNAETDIGTYTVNGIPDEGEGVNAVLGTGSVTWEFPSESNVGTMVRGGDGVNMAADVSDDGNTLTLSFTIDDAGSRIAGFEGEWVFTLTKN